MVTERVGEEMKYVVLKEDMIIPKGTIFKDCVGLTQRFSSGNYQAICAPGNDDAHFVTINDDTIAAKPDLFEMGNA